MFLKHSVEITVCRWMAWGCSWNRIIASDTLSWNRHLPVSDNNGRNNGKDILILGGLPGVFTRAACVHTHSRQYQALSCSNNAKPWALMFLPSSPSPCARPYPAAALSASLLAPNRQILQMSVVVLPIPHLLHEGHQGAPHLTALGSMASHAACAY